MIEHHFAAGAMDAKQRWLRPLGLDRYKGGQLGLPSLTAHQVCQLPDCWGFEKYRQRKPDAELLLDLRQQSYGDQGLAAEVEKVVTHLNRANAENKLPDGDEVSFESRQQCRCRRCLRRRQSVQRVIGASQKSA